mmetsp:Transcript_15750/g.36994  ORF Transcript_15750/g.36994 Transcript_15750/m.36994 type:complete len:558 (-) Transcript_15750:13-1686(-)
MAKIGKEQVSEAESPTKVARGAPWKPYEGCAAETPFLNLFCPFKQAEPALEFWWSARWKVVWPFHWRVPGISWSVGEAIFVPAVIAFCAITCAGSYKNVEGSATPANVLGGLTYATAARNSVFTLMVGIPFERTLFYHKIFALGATITACWHGYMALAWEHTSTAHPMSQWEPFKGGDNFSGSLITIGWIVAIVVAFVYIRRYLFDVFYRLHVVWAAIALYGAIPHGAGLVVMGGACWVFDLLIFALHAAGFHKGGSREATAVVLPAEVVRISFPKKNFKYKGGQYAFLCVPALKCSGYEWHPFSFSSSPHEEDVHIHIRALGNWTQQLLDLIKERQNGSDKPVPLTIFMDGPYGAPGIDIDGPTYKYVLLVSGGIGITPMQSIWGDLLHQYSRGRPLGQLRFVWSCADKAMIHSVGGNVAAVSDGAKRVEAGCMTSQTLPLSFQPPLPSAVADGDDKVVLPAHIKSEFYLTRVRDVREYGAAGINPDVQRHVVFGQRPDFDLIFPDIHEQAMEAGEKRIAVMTCGPQGMVNSVKAACVKHSVKGVTFDLHYEVFEF